MKNEIEEILRYLGGLNLSVRASFFSFLRVVDQFVNTLPYKKITPRHSEG